MSSIKTTWTLGLRPGEDLEGLSMYEVISCLEIVEAGKWQAEGYQPVIFAVVLSDGLTVTVNTIPEGITRMHTPFTHTITVLPGRPMPTMADFKAKLLSQAVEKTVNSNGRKIEWGGMDTGSKLRDCFGLLYGKGPLYELDNDARTAIVPITLEVLPGKRFSMATSHKGSVVKRVLLDDLLMFLGENEGNMEEFSLALAQDIINGNLPMPEEPEIEDLFDMGDPE
jgi:hypothetical protein